MTIPRAVKALVVGAFVLLIAFATAFVLLEVILVFILAGSLD